MQDYCSGRSNMEQSFEDWFQDHVTHAAKTIAQIQTAAAEELGTDHEIYQRVLMPPSVILEMVSDQATRQFAAQIFLGEALKNGRYEPGELQIDCDQANRKLLETQTITEPISPDVFDRFCSPLFRALIPVADALGFMFFS